MTNENQNTEIEVIDETLDSLETPETNETEYEIEAEEPQTEVKPKLSVNDILKSKAAFEDYTVNQPMPLDACEILKNYPKKPVARIADLTQNIETLINKIGNEDFETNQYLVWFVSRTKDEIVNTIKKLNGTNGLGIFIMKALILNDDEIGFECILQPELKEKIKRIINTDTPAKILQKEIWDKYIEICDLSEHPDLQIKEALPRHYQPISINKSGIQLMQTLNTQNGYVASELLINNNKALFNKLFENKEEIESIIGKLEWDSKEGNKSAKIRKTYPIDISNSDNHQIAIEQQLKMGAELKEIAHKYL